MDDGSIAIALSSGYRHNNLVGISCESPVVERSKVRSYISRYVKIS
jgi:hypothetical protein